MDYKNNIGIVTEGNIFDIEVPFKRTVFDLSHKMTMGESYTRILKTIIKSESRYYKEFYDLDIINTGRDSANEVMMFNVFLRISKDDATLRYQPRVEIFSTDSGATPTIYLVQTLLEDGNNKIELYVKTAYNYTTLSVRINLAIPQKCRNYLLSEFKSYTNDEMTEILNASSYNEQIIPNKIFYEDVRLKRVLDAENYVNLYKDISIKGNVNIGTINNKVNTINAKHLKAYEGVLLAPMVDIPTDNLYNGLTIFNHSKKKIITYYDGAWYDANGNVVNS